METKQLEEMLSIINCEHRVVVISADKLLLFNKQNMPPVGYTAIVNTHPSTKSGEHWVCITVISNNEVSIFDSLSSDQHLHNKYFNIFVNLFSKLEKNVGLLQDPFSASCGLFCIYYLYYICNKKMTMASVINLKFTDNVLENECLVLKLIGTKYNSTLYSHVKSTCPKLM